MDVVVKSKMKKFVRGELWSSIGSEMQGVLEDEAFALATDSTAALWGVTDILSSHAAQGEENSEAGELIDNNEAVRH